MFDISFDSEFKPIAFYDEEKQGLRFDPPVYEQRYSTVLRCLQLNRWKGHFKKIVEFGCAEMKFLMFLKSLKGVEHIIQVDIDEETLIRNLYRAEPLICDYLRQRENKLQIDVYRGTIDTEHDCLLNTDAVIGIEIIEHLYPETLENVPNVVFGFMKPKIAMFTTPNSECNVLFDMKDKFRHDDHKFEWTRAQFEDWGHNICTIYPDYKVAFYGIGPGPAGSEHLGCCSQMALFVRNDFFELTSKNSEYSEINANKASEHQINHSEETIIFHENNVNKGKENENEATPIEDIIMEMAATHIDNLDYRLLRSCVYNENRDERTREQKIFDEARYHLGRYMNMDDDHYDYVNDIIKVPVQTIFDFVYKQTEDINEFRYVMRKYEYNIDENDNFLIKPEEREEDDDDEDGKGAYACSLERFESSVGEDKEEENWD